MTRDRVARTIGALAAVSAAVVALVVSPAQAATTYTPSGGPNVNLVGSGVSFTYIEPNQTFTCSTFTMSGPITNPGTSRAYVAVAGSIATLGSRGCTNPITGPASMTKVGAWGLAITGDATGSSWPARLRSVKIDVTFVNCTFSLSGVVNGRFDDSTGTFTPKTGASGLTIDSGSGAPTGSYCPTLDFQSGDNVQVGGSWTNTLSSGGAALDISNP